MFQLKNDNFLIHSVTLYIGVINKKNFASYSDLRNFSINITQPKFSNSY